MSSPSRVSKFESRWEKAFRPSASPGSKLGLVLRHPILTFRKVETMSSKIEMQDKALSLFSHDVINLLGGARGCIECILEWNILETHAPLQEQVRQWLSKQNGSLERSPQESAALLEEAGRILAECDRLPVAETELGRDFKLVVASMSNFLDDIKSLRDMTKEGQVQLEKMDVGKFVRMRLEPLRERAEQNGVRLTFQLDEELSARAQPEMLGRVLENLVGNAIKFTPESAEVRVHACARDGQALIEVADQGVGIKAERLVPEEDGVAPIFKLGKNYSTQGVRGQGGTGYGLPLCYYFMRKMDGGLSVESADGKGTTFTVSLQAA